MTTFSQVAMFYLVLCLRFLRLLCFTWFCDYIFSGGYVLLGFVTTFSQVAMFYLVL